ncbi:MAG: hypothetical protein IT270_05090 [Saprospiraceae bacterium]|nr:hypothetical protein [Saprospiraceae bacterium]
MNLRILFCLFFIPSFLFGQSVEWASYNATDYVWAGKVVASSNGNTFYAATGLDNVSCWPAPCQDLSIGANEGAFVIRYDSDGNQTAGKTFAPEVDFRTYAVDLEDAPGNGVYLLHRNVHFAEIFQDLFLTRLDEDLNMVWQVNITSDVNAVPLGLASDGDGNVFVAYNQDWPSANDTFFVRKYLPDGQIAWTQSGVIANSFFDLVFSGFDASPDGKVAFFMRLTGTFQMDGIQLNDNTVHHLLGVLDGQTGQSTGFADLFTESTQWTNYLPLNLSIDPENNYVLSFRSSVPLVLQGETINHAPTGTTGWWSGVATLKQDFSFKNVVTLGTDQFLDVTVVTDALHDDQGNLFVGGYRSKTDDSGTFVFGDEPVDVPAFPNQIFVAKFDPSGNYLWSQQWGSWGWVPFGNENIQDRVNDLDLTPDGRLVAHGIVKYDSTLLAGNNVWHFLTSGFVVQFGNDNLMRGEVWIDLNNDGIRDAQEPPFAYALLGNGGGTLHGFGGLNGKFNLPGRTPTMTLLPENAPENFSVDPPEYQVDFTNSNGEIIDSLDFRLVPDFLFNDLKLVVTPTTAFRPGFEARWQMRIENFSTTAQYITAKVSLPYFSNYQSSQPAAMVLADTLVWQFNGVEPFGHRLVSIQALVSDTAQLNNGVDLYAKLNTPTGELTPSDNETIVYQLVTGSYDPNDKSSIPTGQVLADLTPELLVNPVDYLVRFQNTGTDTAFRVMVVDTLSWLLNPASLRVLDQSHPMEVEIWNNRTVAFVFNNILLPDSNTNEAASHGFVRFSVKPADPLEPLDSVINRAAIYFDFNAPVITNEALIVIVISVGTYTPVDGLDFTVFPNPATDRLRLETPDQLPEGGRVDLYDIQQRQLLSQPTNPGQTMEMNLSGIPTGVCVLVLYDAHGRILGAKKVEKM